MGPLHCRPEASPFVPDALARGVARDPAWRNVALLAGVSLINDISGEMLMAVLPFLLVSQGATGLGLGLVGGVTEGTGHLTKLLGGWLGQRRARKPLIGAGYLTAALSRFGIAFASTWGIVMILRSLDRVGKGLRTAPRDAMLAEQLPADRRGRAFGFHRAADTTGAVIGVLLTLALIGWLGASDQHVVLVGAAIGLLSLVPLLLVREPPRDAPLQGAVAKVPEAPSPLFAPFLLVAVAFSLARVSYLFYLVRAAGAAGGMMAAIAWYLWFNLVYAAAAYPVGRLGDAIGRSRLLVVGYLGMAVTALLFALPPTVATMAAGFTLLGWSFALVEGQGATLAADLAGSEHRSTRLGQYHAFTGVATVVGGIAAGLLWDHASPSAAFVWGAALPLVAAIGLAALPGLVTNGGTRAGPPAP